MKKITSKKMFLFIILTLVITLVGSKINALHNTDIVGYPFPFLIAKQNEVLQEQQFLPLGLFANIILYIAITFMLAKITGLLKISQRNKAMY